MQNSNLNTPADKQQAGKKDETFRDKVGGAIEGVGQKLADAGAKGLGQKVYNVGDSIEETHKNPNHPKKV